MRHGNRMASDGTSESERGLNIHGTAHEIIRTDRVLQVPWSQKATGGATEERIMKKTEEATDLLRHYDLTPEQAIDLLNV